MSELKIKDFLKDFNGDCDIEIVNKYYSSEPLTSYFKNKKESAISQYGDYSIESWGIKETPMVGGYYISITLGINYKGR